MIIDEFQEGKVYYLLNIHPFEMITRLLNLIFCGLNEDSMWSNHIFAANSENSDFSLKSLFL